MKFRQLEYFVAIAEEKQITAAARRLNISQPPLSYELAALEEEMGVKLVNRNSRGVTLTAAGEVLYERAKQMIAISEATLNEVAEFGKGQKGVVSLGIVPSAVSVVPGKGIADVFDASPDIRIEVYEGSTQDAIERLERGVIDVAIVRTPFASKDLMCRYLDPEAMVVVARPDRMIGKKADKIALDELDGVPVILSRKMNAAIRNVFEMRALELKVAFETDDVRTACTMAISGAGIAIAPRSISDIIAGKDVAVKPIDCRDLTSQVVIVWRKDRELSPIAQRFVDIMGGSEKPYGSKR